MIDKDLTFQIKTALQKEPGVLAAYIIGSMVSGQTTGESDFDLAVVVKSKKNLSEDKIYELVRDLNFPRDLDLSVVDKTSSPVFLYQIVSRGKKIFGQVEFEAFALHNYYDTAYLRGVYEQALEKKFAYAS